MKKHLFLTAGILLSFCGTPMLAPTAQSATLHGNVVSSTDPTTQIGIYSFTTENPTVMTPVYTKDNLTANGGGVYIDGKFYMMNYSQMGSLLMTTYTTYDATTWETLASGYPSIGKWSDIAISSAYDKTTGTVYCCTQNDTQSAFLLRTWNVEASTKTTIAEAGTGYPALAVNSTGELFGINPEGKLYKLDKTNGNATLIGDTGFKPKGMQSATFDDKSGKLYWFAYNNDSSNLYEVNTSTAELTLVSELPDMAEVVSAYVPKPEAEDKAPAKVDNLTVSFPNGNLSGTINFTIPSKHFDGTDMTENVGYSISLNGEQIISKSDIQPGAEISEDITVEQSGTYEIQVTANNTTGNSPAAKTELWIGNDTPNAISNLSVSKESDTKVVLTWEAPTSAVHNGYINPEKITYKIIRQPDNTVVAENLTETTYSEEITTEEMKAYSYEVYASFEGLESTAAKSDYIIFGSYVSVPFYETFDTNSNMPLFTIIDANKDNVTWTYDNGNKSLYCRTMGSNPSDEYAITPPLKLNKDNAYNLSFDIRKIVSDNAAQRIEVLIGNKPEIESLQTVLIKEQDVTENERSFLTEFSVENDGLYYIAVHLTTPAQGLYVYLDNIKVEGTAQNAPDQATELKATPAPLGELKADISFRTPDKLVNGTAANSLTKVELYRESELINTFENPAPATVLTFTDESAAQGINKYRVFAYNENGIGKMAECEAYIGIDIPGLVQNIKFSDMGDGNNKITWEAPNTGEHDGYIIPENLTYSLYRNVNSQETLIVSELTETAYTDTECPISEDSQSIVYYTVRATNEIGTGTGASSNALQVGTPYPAPLAESFANASLSTSPWIVDRLSGTSEDVLWTLLRQGADGETAQDNDGGFAGFAGYIDGAKAAIVSPKIDISTLEKPGVSFYANIPYPAVAFTPVISVDNGEYQPIHEVIFNDKDFQSGWKYMVIPLTEYTNAQQVRIGFMGEIDGDNGAMYIDNVIVSNFFDKDLSVESMSAPNSATSGDICALTATIANIGLTASEPATVALKKNGEIAEQQEINALEPGEKTTVTFKYNVTQNDLGSELQFTIELLSSDDNEDNNARQCNIAVKSNNYPVPANLAAVADKAKVSLTWEKPEFSDGIHASTTDDFESYDAFIIDNIGDYTLIDNDKSMTYRLGNTDYENSTALMAFQVFNPEEAKITNSAFTPHSGKQMLIAVASIGGTNDDWLISPELASDNHIISFYAKSFTDKYGLEEFEVWYSTTGTNQSDFQKLTDKTQYAPAEWTEFVFIMPEGTKHFAFRYISKDKYALGIDDLSFATADSEVTKLTLQGYNVYRNSERINQDVVTTETYTDEVKEAGEYTYQVTAVYDLGESRLSEGQTVTIDSSVEELSSKTLVFGCEEGIRIINAIGSAVTVSRLDGISVLSTVVENYQTTLPMESGLYIVTVGNRSHKVFVK